MMKITNITLLSLLVLLPCSVYVAFGNNDQQEEATACSAGDDGQCANEDGLALLSLSSKVTKNLQKVKAHKHQRASLFQSQSAVQQAAEAAREKKIMSLVETFHAAKLRKAWTAKNNELRKKADYNAGEFGKFLEQIQDSGDACSAKLLETSKNLHALHDHVETFLAQVATQEELLATEDSTLEAAKDAIAGAAHVRDTTIDDCKAAMQEAAEDAARYAEELVELAQIADPDVRANMVGVDAVKAARDLGVDPATATDVAHPDLATGDEDDGAAEALLETGSSVAKKKHALHRGLRSASKKSWSKAQCLNFLQWKKKTAKQSSSLSLKRLSAIERGASITKGKGKAKGKAALKVALKQAPTADDTPAPSPADAETADTPAPAATEEATPAPATEDATPVPAPEHYPGEEQHIEPESPTFEEDCEEALDDIQAQFTEAYQGLEKVHDDRLHDSIDETCINQAHADFDIINIPESERREHATDKIVEVQEALGELRAVIAILKQQDSDLSHHVALLRDECASTSELSVYLTRVHDLIFNAAECPGVQETTLILPQDRCRTDGSGSCSWECSSEGQVFAHGGWYGNIPGYEGYTSGKMGAKLACEATCISNVQCVGFTLHHGSRVDHYECFHKLDVLAGRFVDQGPVMKNEHPILSCYIPERQDIVNLHRDPAHPGITHNNVVDYWYQLNEGPSGSACLVEQMKEIFAHDGGDVPAEICALFSPDVAATLSDGSINPNCMEECDHKHEDDLHSDEERQHEGGDPEADPDTAAQGAPSGTNDEATSGGGDAGNAGGGGDAGNAGGGNAGNAGGGDAGNAAGGDAGNAAGGDAGNAVAPVE